MKGVCRICACTDDNACVTETGPCHWITEDLCSACADVIPELHLIIPRMCRYCQQLKPDEFRVPSSWYTCSKGRFDGAEMPASKLALRKIERAVTHQVAQAAGYHRYFAWSGIWRVRYKTLKKAQRYCPEFIACKNIDQIHEKGRPA